MPSRPFERTFLDLHNSASRYDIFLLSFSLRLLALLMISQRASLSFTPVVTTDMDHSPIQNTLFREYFLLCELK
jgi:hypothetical protein